jgi:predicted acyltransferase
MLGPLINRFPLYDLHHLRIPGILQRIALCYAAASLLYLAVGDLSPSDRAETAPAAI